MWQLLEFMQHGLFFRTRIHEFSDGHNNTGARIAGFENVERLPFFACGETQLPEKQSKYYI